MAQALVVVLVVLMALAPCSLAVTLARPEGAIKGRAHLGGSACPLPKDKVDGVVGR